VLALRAPILGSCRGWMLPPVLTPCGWPRLRIHAGHPLKAVPVQGLARRWNSTANPSFPPATTQQESARPCNLSLKRKGLPPVRSRHPSSPVETGQSRRQSLAPVRVRALSRDYTNDRETESSSLCEALQQHLCNGLYRTMMRFPSFKKIDLPRSLVAALSPARARTRDK
jgi:hypothetical protein